MASAPQEVWGDLATTAFVEASHLFKSLDPAAREDLVKLARLVRYAAGETISPEGDDAVHLLVDGTAAVRVRSAEGSLEVSTLERGAFFGVARALGAERPSSLEARTEVTAVVFPAAMIGALADQFPKMRKLLEVMLAARDKEAADGAAGPRGRA